MYPEPPLLGIESIALLVFDQVADCWEDRGGDLSGHELGFFRMDQAKIVAEAYGVEWEGYLQDLVRRCAMWYREEVRRIQRKRRKKLKDTKQLDLREPADGRRKRRF